MLGSSSVIERTTTIVCSSSVMRSHRVPERHELLLERVEASLRLFWREAELYGERFHGHRAILQSRRSPKGLM